MYVITGGAGFLGSNLAAGMEEREMGEITIVDRFETDNRWRNIAKRSLREIVFPERMFEYLDKHADQIDAVIHISYTGFTDENNVDALIEERVHLTFRLWTWCAEHRKPFIYDSTAGVYGNGTLGFKDDDSAEALAKLRPLSAEAWTKLFLDRKIVDTINRGEAAPPQWIGLRCFNLYGPNEYHNTRHQSVIPRIYNAAKNGKLFPLFKSANPAYKDGEQMRDFMWIKDTVDVILWLVTHKEISGLFNIGTGRARTYADVLKATYEAVGEEPEMDFMDLPTEIKEQYQYFTQADIQKLRTAGYTKDFTSLEEGVKQYVQDYLEQPDPYR